MIAIPGSIEDHRRDTLGYTTLGNKSPYCSGFIESIGWFLEFEVDI
jgi:hypothetical protein